MWRVAILFATLLSSTSARAQLGSPYSVTVYREGPGIRLGAAPLVLHPGVAVDSGYDSNIYYLPSDPIGAGILRVRAHLDLATLPPPAEGDASTADPKIEFRLSGQAEYRGYLLPDLRYVSQETPNVTASASLALFPKGPFTLRLDDLYVRTIDPLDYESPANLVRDYERGALWASYRIHRLELALGDAFTMNYWESGQLRFGDSLADEGQAQAKLGVGGRTFLTLTGRFGWVHYVNDEAADSLPLRAVAGVVTEFGTSVAASATVGYGDSENRHGESFRGVIGSVELRFRLPHEAHVRIGYDRDFHDSIFANALVDDHAFVAFEQPFTRRVAVRLGGGLRLRKYLGLIDPALIGATGYSSQTRADLIYEAHAELSVRLADWLALGATYDLVADDTSFEFDEPAPVSASYVKHSAFLRFDFAY